MGELVWVLIWCRKRFKNLSKHYDAASIAIDLVTQDILVGQEIGK